MNKIQFRKPPNPQSVEMIYGNEKKNCYSSSNGTINKVFGYKTFKGMINQFKKINTLNKKTGFKATYTITLPLK